MAMVGTLPKIGKLNPPLVLALALSGAAFAVLLVNIGASLPQWQRLLTAPDSDLAVVAVRYGLLPRFALSLVAGAALGLSGVLFQQVLRNPLAEPGTLAVFSGAKCALIVATLWMPGLLAYGQEPVILIGGLAALGFVLLLAVRSGFLPLTVILAGLVLSLCLEAISSMLFLVRFEDLSDLLTWQTGSLVQNNWDGAVALSLVLSTAVFLTLLLKRPMILLDLGEAGARSAGVSLFATRLTILSIAAALSAMVAADAAIIGFVGLAGPAVARLAGARRLDERLVYGPLLSAGMLGLVDQGLFALAGGMDVPAGAMTALLGTPLLIWLVCRMRTVDLQQPLPLDHPVPEDPRGRYLWFAVVAFLLAVVFLLALAVGQGPDGWHFATGEELRQLIAWRLPRIAAAGAGGLMLAVAGSVLQRLTGNSLASPELLGISSGAALVLMIAVFFLPPLTHDDMILLSAAGAFVILCLTLWLGRRSAFSPERMLLTGVALGALTGSLSSLLTLLGDMRVLRLLGWLAGSTYSVTGRDAWFAVCLALLSLALLPLFARWLRILPLGGGVASSIGTPVAASRLVLMIFTAILTGAATLIVGPLSFAGLAAPHLARISGLRTPLAQAYGAALLGTMIMVLADWIGRNVAFPWQVPAGIVATLLGGLYFILLAMKR